MSDQEPPVELPRDVFLLLLDAYRERLVAPIHRAFAAGTPQRRQYLDQIDADCNGWRTRYACAVAREGAAEIPVTNDHSH